MESIVTGIVSVVFKVLDKYVVYNMATTSILPRISLFTIFALIEFIIIFSVLENILEDIIKACFRLYRNQEPISTHLDIQTFITLLITAHSIINKALIYSGFEFLDSFLIAFTVLLGLTIFVFEQYGLVYRFVTYEEKKDIVSKKQKIEDSQIQNFKDSFVVISFEEEKPISNRIQTQQDKKQNEQNTKFVDNQTQAVQITHFYWVLIVIYLILTKWYLKQYVDVSTNDFQKFKYMAADFFFLYPILSANHKIEKYQLYSALTLNIFSQLFFINISEIHILITYTVLILTVKKYGNNALHLVITILMLMYLNDFILQFIIQEARMHFSIKIIFYAIGLAMLCFFYRITHEGLIYASFLPAIQFILYMIWFFVFVFHIEKQVYSTQSYLTDLIKEQAGLAVLLNFEIAIFKKISSKISQYLNYNSQNNNQYTYQQNIVLEILNDNLFKVIWYQDPLMKISLKKMNLVQFYVCYAFMHFFFGSPNMQNKILFLNYFKQNKKIKQDLIFSFLKQRFSFVAFYIILTPYFWVSSFRSNRYQTFILITFSYVSKYMMNKGLNFILKYLINLTLVIFSWKRSLLANLIPVMLENYAQIMTQQQQGSSSEDVFLNNQSASNWEIFIVFISLISAIGFLVKNPLINNITKRLRNQHFKCFIQKKDLLIPFMVYFLVFQNSSSYSKYICLNFMICFVQDLGILTRDM